MFPYSKARINKRRKYFNKFAFRKKKINHTKCLLIVMSATIHTSFTIKKTGQSRIAQLNSRNVVVISRKRTVDKRILIDSLARDSNTEIPIFFVKSKVMKSLLWSFFYVSLCPLIRLRCENKMEIISPPTNLKLVKQQ